MSKIAEKKVKELGYSKDPWGRDEYTANDVFYAAVECYDQAMQDFIEKACEWLKKNADSYTWYNEMEGESGMIDEFIDDFKNYMKVE